MSWFMLHGLLCYSPPQETIEHERALFRERMCREMRRCDIVGAPLMHGTTVLARLEKFFIYNGNYVARFDCVYDAGALYEQLYDAEIYIESIAALDFSAYFIWMTIGRQKDWTTHTTPFKGKSELRKLVLMNERASCVDVHVGGVHTHRVTPICFVDGFVWFFHNSLRVPDDGFGLDVDQASDHVAFNITWP